MRSWALNFSSSCARSTAFSARLGSAAFLQKATRQVLHRAPLVDGHYLEDVVVGRLLQLLQLLHRGGELRSVAGARRGWYRGAGGEG